MFDQFSIFDVMSIVGLDAARIRSNSGYYDCPICGGKKKLNVNVSKGHGGCLLYTSTCAKHAGNGSSPAWHWGIMTPSFSVLPRSAWFQPQQILCGKPSGTPLS